MTTHQLASLPDFTLEVLAEERMISSVYCADLLSWAMSRAPQDCAWCTVMGNINAVAVASLADVAVLILCESAQLDGDARDKAIMQGIAIARTPLPAFEAGLAIAKTADLYQ